MRALALGIFALFTVAGSFTEAQQTYRAENAQEHPAPHQWAREQSLIKFAAIADAVQPRSAKESDNDPQHQEHWWDKAWRHWVRRFFADAKITDAVVAIATAFLAIFTYRLWVSTNHMWKATKRSADIAERSLTDLERPFLYIQITHTGAALAELGVMNITGDDIKYRFVNYGRTPAHLVNYIHEVRTSPVADGPVILPPPIDPHTKIREIFPEGTVIAQGKHREFTCNIMTDLGGDNLIDVLAGVMAGTHNALLQGYIRYEDIFGRRYLCGFCAMLIRTENIFVRIGGGGNNYMKKEEPEATPERIREQRPIIEMR